MQQINNVSQGQDVEIMREFNTALSVLLDKAFHMPRIQDYGNEVEALSHVIAIRLGLLERALKRRSIFAASSDIEILALEHRLQGLQMQGVDVESPLVIGQE